MLVTVLFLKVFIAGVMAGTRCPPRENIYPCSCINTPQGRYRNFTAVYCHRLESTDSMNNIFSALREMQIDVFHLYDSFWEAHKNNLAEKKKMPSDWLTLLRVREIEIVDTTLDSCFACSSKLACRNVLLTKFTAVNSSSHAEICTLCNSPRGNNIKFSWISCMTKLKEFRFTHAKLSTIGNGFIPEQMKELTVLSLNHNEIVTVHPKLFENVPRLKILDLSHNRIFTLSNMFTSEMPDLEFLDISWNSITTLGNNFFRRLQFLKRFNVENNLIVDMKEMEWKDVSENLKYINLKGNQLHCDCHVRWINTVFHVNNTIRGECFTPREVKGRSLKFASKTLDERCVGTSIGPFKKRTTKAIKV